MGASAGAILIIAASAKNTSSLASSEPYACFYDSECDGDRICSFAHCLPARCGPGQGCCQERIPNLPNYCHSDADCGKGKHCTITISGLDQCCKSSQPPEPTSCFYDSECHGDRICSYPHCFPSRFDDVGMGVCMNRQPDQVCSSNADCSAGKHCELLTEKNTIKCCKDTVASNF